ncbi:Na+:solute symporter [soil metagenome]
MLDLAILLAFVIFAVGAGFRSRRKASRGMDEYFLAGRTLSGWRAGLSMAATQFAADTPLLVAGLVATGGVFLLWRLWIYGLAFLLMAFVFSALWRRAGVLTDAELTEVRYSGRGVVALRGLKAIYYGTLINCVVMAMVLVAAVRIAEVFLPWQEWLPAAIFDPVVAFVGTTGLTFGAAAPGLAPEVATASALISIVLILAFTALYATTGGLRSVVTTDVLQFALAMIGTAVYAWVVVDQAGGLAAMPGRVAQIYGDAEASAMLSFGPPAFSAEVLLPFLTIIGLQWFFQMNSDGTGYLAQRSMACRTDADARLAGVVFPWAQILVRSLIWLLIAVGLLIVYPFTAGDAGAEGFAAAREAFFVTGIDDLLPPGIRGLMLVGLLAALASTIDTHLNWGASYWSNDLYGRVYCERFRGRAADPRALVRVARFANIFLILIALVIMANLGSIQEAWMMSLMLGAGMGSVLVLRWLWERINLWSEVAAIVSSLVLAPVLLFVVDFGADASGEAWRLGLMSLGSTVAAVSAAFVTAPTDQSRLVEFYRRVRPVGAWGRTDVAAGASPGEARRALGRQLIEVGVTALSLFTLLVGLGRLLIPPPGAAGWVSVLLCVIGLALIPIWLRALRRERHVETTGGILQSKAQ